MSTASEINALALRTITKLETQLSQGVPMVGPDGTLVKDEFGEPMNRELTVMELKNLAGALVQLKKLVGEIIEDDEDKSVRDRAVQKAKMGTVRIPGAGSMPAVSTEPGV